MSESTDPELDLDLQFLPDWAKEPAEQNRYANFRGEPERRPGRDRRPGPPRERGRSEARRREPGRRSPGGRREGGRGPKGGRDRGRSRPPREAAPLPEVGVGFVPEEAGVDSLVKQIRKTGRAYPLVEIARMILQKPERYQVKFNIKKDSQGQPKQPLYLCMLDNSLWLSEEEVVHHVLGTNFELFYEVEKIPTDPPKGTYTFVAQCGMSGVILGPPNYHDYQKQLHALHAERFPRMPFEKFKSRVKMVRDEEVVKKWVEEQSFKTEYICLNLPEPLKLKTRAEVEQHFRQHHLPNLIQQVDSFSTQAADTSKFSSGPLHRLVRRHAEEQRRFPLQLMTALSQQFGARGLQFFKVNKTITHVAVARPHYLDLENTPVSEGVRAIVEFINAHPDANRKILIETLAPSPEPPAAPAEAPPGDPGQQASPAPADAAPTPTPEQTAVIGDLHWLIHQGHVIEFATGKLETAKKPAQPPKPRKTPASGPKAASRPASSRAAESASQPTPAATSSASASPTVSAPAPSAPTDDASPASDASTTDPRPDEPSPPQTEPGRPEARSQPLPPEPKAAAENDSADTPASPPPATTAEPSAPATPEEGPPAPSPSPGAITPSTEEAGEPSPGQSSSSTS